jgi:hypothetical protein
MSWSAALSGRPAKTSSTASSPSCGPTRISAGPTAGRPGQRVSPRKTRASR